MERREALRSAMSERSSWEMGLMILILFHDAALLVDMIVAEVVIASLLVLASKKLIETE
jgi:hypothetical protein